MLLSSVLNSSLGKETLPLVGFLLLLILAFSIASPRFSYRSKPWINRIPASGTWIAHFGNDGAHTFGRT